MIKCFKDKSVQCCDILVVWKNCLVANHFWRPLGSCSWATFLVVARTGRVGYPTALLAKKMEKTMTLIINIKKHMTRIIHEYIWSVLTSLCTPYNSEIRLVSTLLRANLSVSSPYMEVCPVKTLAIITTTNLKHILKRVYKSQYINFTGKMAVPFKWRAP